MRPTHILTGANGWLGDAVARALPTKPITLLRSSGADQPNAHNLHGDISDEGFVAAALTQLEAIGTQPEILIHCAGLAHQPIEFPAVVEAMWKTNDQGTRNVLQFCKQAGIKRFVYISTIAGYQWDQSPQSEDAPLLPITAYAKSKLAGERHALESGLDTRIVRLATVYGKGDKANFLKLSTALKARRFPLPGKAEARKSVIPIDLAAKLIVQLSLLESAPYLVINFALPEAPTLGEICHNLASSCDFPQPIRLPSSVMKGLALAGDLIGKLRPATFDSKILNKLTTSTWVDTVKLQQTFPKEKFNSFAESLKSHHHYYKTASNQFTQLSPSKEINKI